MNCPHIIKTADNLMTRLAELQAELQAELAAEQQAALDAGAAAITERAKATEFGMHWRQRESHLLASVGFKIDASRHSHNAFKLRSKIISIQQLMQEDANMASISNEQFLRRLTLTAEQMAAVDDTAGIAS